MTPRIWPAREVAAIERATLQAVVPDHCLHWPGWLLPMTRGTVGRAQSATPLSHDVLPTAEFIDQLAQTYRAQGHVPAMRLPEGPAWATVHAHLQSRGWQRSQPTWTLIHQAQALLDRVRPRDLQAISQVLCNREATPPWLALFLGPGFDPVDGEHRRRLLARSRCTLYAGVPAEAAGPHMRAVGAGTLAEGWLGLHGLRTQVEERGKGWARAIMMTLTQAAVAQDIEQVFLQVDAANEAAISLYRQLGFAPGWCYAYWRLT